MFDITFPVFKFCLICVAAFSILLSSVSARKETPVLALVNRWLRWVLFAWFFAFLMKTSGLSSRPDWVHILVGFMLWFLIETGYNWIVIKVLSSSDMPLFPRFSSNEDGDEWPAGKRFEKIKNWLKNERFERISTLKAELFEGISLRASIYESSDKLTRLQILFIPKRKNGISTSYTLSTNGASGSRLITDNGSHPFGGYYPENWDFVRKPLVGSLASLFRIHKKHLSKTNFEPIPFEDEPLKTLNQQQHLLEQLNTKCGFLNPLQYREESGQFTYDGRYRLWKEMWLLAYLGKSVSS